MRVEDCTRHRVNLGLRHRLRHPVGIHVECEQSCTIWSGDQDLGETVLGDDLTGHESAVAVLQVEPCGSYFSWHDRDPNRAKAIVQAWYQHTFLPCCHKLEELVDDNAELGDPPAYYQCSRCTVIVARSELQLLQVQ